MHVRPGQRKSLQDGSAGNRSMSVASHVGRNGSKGNGEADGLGIHQPKRHKASPCVRAWEVSHTSCCDCAQNIGSRRGKQPGCSCQRRRFEKWEEHEQFGTLRMMLPPMIRATTCTASPTDLSSVVLVVLKPMSRIMTVENELTTPLGMALRRDVSVLQARCFAWGLTLRTLR